MLSKYPGTLGTRLRCRAHIADSLCKQLHPLYPRYTIRSIITFPSEAGIITRGSLKRYSKHHTQPLLVQFSTARRGNACPGAIEEDNDEPSPQGKTDAAAKKEDEFHGVWQSASDVLKEVNQEKTEFVGAKEVDANFGYIRSTFQQGHKLDKEQWESLREKLQQGFTAAQLTDYINQSKQKPAAMDGSPKCLDTWRPGVSRYIELTTERPRWIPDGLRSLNGVSGKGLLAEQILRDCWLLSILDEVGQIDVQLRQRDVLLLMGRDGDQLRELSKKYNAKVDVSRVLNIVRITGTESVCHRFRDAVISLLSKAHTKTINLVDQPLLGGHKDKHQLQIYTFLEKRYGVLCEKDNKKKTLDIYYLDHAESGAEEVRRNMELLMAKQYEYTGPFTSYTPPSSDTILIPVVNPKALPWPNRDTQYLRWLKPSLKPRSKLDSKHGPPERLSTTELPPALFNRNREPPVLQVISDAIFGDGGSHSNYFRNLQHVREVVTATPGKCLMRHRTGIKGGIYKWRQLARKVARRAFTKDVPNLRYFLERQKLIPSSEELIRYRLRLTPSASAPRKLPLVEFELDAPPTSGTTPDGFKPAIKSASAILDEKSIDLLMPDSHLDLRFTNAAHYDFFKDKVLAELTETDKNDPSISSIFECVRNLPYGEPMPVSCHLTIPGKLLKCEKGDERPNFVTAEYFFSPLKSVSASRTGRFIYNDFELNYTYLGAGPVFASAAEDVTLFLNRHNTERRPANLHEAGGVLAGETLRKAFGTFYARACRLPFELSSMRPPRARDFDTADKPVRQRPATGRRPR